MKSFLLISVGVFLMWVVATQAWADDATEAGFFNQHAQGWHWYAPEPEPESETSSPSSPSTASSSQSLDPIAQVQAITHAVEEAKAQAVLNPTPNNVAQYIALQNAVTQNAKVFGGVWQQVIWQQPSLNYSLSHPTNQLAKNAWLDTQHQQNAGALQVIAQQYGLFFFFAGSCPYCHKFAPIVKAMQTQYGFSVIPVSLDGGGLPDYPQPQIDKGQAKKFNVTQWPALFLVNPNTRQIIPVTFGLISQDELTTRIVTLVTQLNAQGKTT